MKTMTVLVTAFNQWDLTERCLRSLLQHSRITKRVVVVDNASSDLTPTQLPSWKDRFLQQGIDFIIDTPEKNLGFANGMNRAWAVARKIENTKYFCVANNDIELSPDWDQGLVESLERLGVDGVSPWFIEGTYHDSIPQKLIEAQMKNRGRKRKQYSLILAVFRSSMLDEIGLFDSRFFVGYEDADLHYRMERFGKKHWLVGDVVIWHHSKGTRGGNRDLETFGDRVFREIWGFGATDAHHTLHAKWLRFWRGLKARRGLL